MNSLLKQISFNSITILFCMLFIITNNKIVSAKKSKTENCKLCTDLVNDFVEGLKRTSKGNFGGGNTDWEDRKLGNYLKSETRFEEIIENICSEFECHRLLEEQEDTLLDWFKNKQNKIESDLQSYLCITNLKYCCASGTYGPGCTSCPQNFGLICSGNGDCDGSGTRSGSGKCLCNNGYAGELCQECAKNFYIETKNDSHVKCAECHRSCESCTGPDQKSCNSCRSGWKYDETNQICEDINECLIKENPCSKHQYCENSDGSYNCYECDPACKACTEKGADKCLSCNDGFTTVQDSNLNIVCQDINECENDPKICPNNKKCVNKPGTYECIEETLKETSNSSANESNQSNQNQNTNENNTETDYDYEDDDEENVKEEL